MRCPDCNKFVPYDEPQCETGSVDVDGTMVRTQVTVQLNCAECGGTLKDAEIEAEVEIDHTCKPEAEREKDWTPDPDYVEADGEEQFEVADEGSPEGNDRLEDKDRHGKTIKNYRYMKRFYGFTQEVDIKCRKCGETFSVRLSGEVQASSFNECC